MSIILLTIAVAVISYLLGCISTGLIIAKRSGVNLREQGSKSTGASNALRVMGLKKGMITFLGDFFKAAIACLVGNIFLPGDPFGIPGFGIMLAGLCVVIGHNWPIFYGFKGGKGIACSVAVIFFVNPLWGIISILLCVIIIAITRFISVGSMTMLLSYMIMMIFSHPEQWFVWFFSIFLFVMSVYRHRENIRRLFNGTENKIGHRAK